MKQILIAVFLALASDFAAAQAPTISPELGPIVVSCPGAASFTPLLFQIANPSRAAFEDVFDEFADAVSSLVCVAEFGFTPKAACNVNNIPTVLEAQTCTVNFIADTLAGVSESAFLDLIIPESGPIESDGTGSANDVTPGGLTPLENCTRTLGIFGCTFLISDVEKAALSAASPNGAQQAIIDNTLCAYNLIALLIDLFQGANDPFPDFDVLSLLTEVPPAIGSGIVDACKADPEVVAYYETLSVRRTDPPSAGSISTYSMFPAMLSLAMMLYWA